MFSARALTAANFDDDYVHSIFEAGGLVTHRDGVFHYAAMVTSVFRFMVVRRTSEITFSDHISRLDAEYRVVINGNYFTCASGGNTCYLPALAFDIHRPDEIISDGDVRQGGTLVLPDGGPGPNLFYFGRGSGSAAADYQFGTGNPPAAVHEGMGGMGPLILTNPATRARVKYGVSTLYESGHSGGPALGDPGTHWSACIQRSSATYASINSQIDSGIGAVAVVRDKGLLFAVVKPDGESGDLDAVRDKLWNVGADGACFTDGSSSACMAIDRRMQIRPARFKNRLIEVGIGFFQYRGVT